MLNDLFGRTIDYVRLALTDRCNLRCTYCMSETPDFMPSAEQWTLAEIERLLALMAHIGIRKLRITGGEPLLRRDIDPIMQLCANHSTITSRHITTNATRLMHYSNHLLSWKLSGINISIDTLREDRFHMITRRHDFRRIWDTIYHCITLYEESPDVFPAIKLNVVVMDNVNTDELLDFVALTRQLPITVRFIEQMPFDGRSERMTLAWDHTRILRTIAENVELIALPFVAQATAQMYMPVGHRGHIGIIAGFSRTFCGTCNRLRITAGGMVQTCLYDRGSFNIRTAMRSGMSDQDILEHITHVVVHRASDGHSAEERHSRIEPVYFPSMSAIGG